MAATNPLVANAETIAKGLPGLWDIENSGTYSRLAKSKGVEIVETPNAQDFRIPVELAPAGIYGGFSPAGGSMGQTSGPTLEQFYQTAKYQKVGFDLNVKDIWNTESSKSNINLLKKTIKDAIPTAKRYANASLFSDGHTMAGKGLLAKATALSTYTYTFETQFRGNLLVPGQAVEVITGDLATWRTSTESAANTLPTIASISKDYTQATLAGASGVTLAATDYLAIPGSISAGPALAWVNGLYFFHTTATSGSIMGINVATYPIVLPSTLNVAGAMSVTAGYQLQAAIRQRRGSIGPLKGIMHSCQAAALAILATTISEFQRGKSDGMIDLAPNVLGSGKDEITQWGVNHFIDPLASKTRVEWYDAEGLQRVQIKPLDFYKNPGDGRMFFEKRGSSGGVNAGVQFFLAWAENFAYPTMNKGGFMYGLSIPSNF